MNIGDKFHATLRIKQTKENTEGLDILLDFQLLWRNIDWSMQKKILKYEVKGIINKLLTEPKDIMREHENMLMDIGGLIYGLFPKKICEGLKYLDAAAKKLLSCSNSRITLTIVVDKLDIPWELSLTSDRETYFCKRYLVARQIESFTCDDEQEKKEELKKIKEILLIMETFDIKKMEANSETSTELILINEKLKNLIKIINNKEDIIKIKLLKYGTPINELKEMLKGSFDAIIYIGPYGVNDSDKVEGLVAENPFSPHNLEIIHYEHINPSKDSHPLIFFDACRTVTRKLSVSCNNISVLPISNLVDYYLGKNKNFSAFVGTIQNVEAVTATAFAYYFIESICQRGASLSQAILDARNFIDKNFTEQKMRCIQSCSYSLIGKDHDSLHTSFIYNKKQIRLIWHESLDPYCKQFGEEIYPSGLDILDLIKCRDFDDLKEQFEKLEGEISEDSNLIPIIDIPIPYAAQIISNTKKLEDGWVIINSVFQPKLDESALYYVDNLEKVVDFYLENNIAQVSVMSYIILKKMSESFFTKCSCTKVEYKDILERIKCDIKEKKIRPIAFILVGGYRIALDDLLNEQVDKIRDRFKCISLQREFKTIAEEGQYKIKCEQPPASVLLVKRSHVIRYRKLIVRVLSNWYEWIDKCFNERNEKLARFQKPLFKLEEDHIDAIINFSELILNKGDLNNWVFAGDLKIKRPLNKNDFLVIIPEQLDYNEPLTNLHKQTSSELEEFKHELDQSLIKKCNQIEEILRKDLENYKREMDLNRTIDTQEKERLKKLIEDKARDQELKLKELQFNIRTKIDTIATMQEYEILVSQINSIEQGGLSK